MTTTDAQGNAHRPAGTPDGGKFAVQTKQESTVTLSTAERYAAAWRAAEAFDTAWETRHALIAPADALRAPAIDAYVQACWPDAATFEIHTDFVDPATLDAVKDANGVTLWNEDFQGLDDAADNVVETIDGLLNEPDYDICEYMKNDDTDDPSVIAITVGTSRKAPEPQGQEAAIESIIASNFADESEPDDGAQEEGDIIQRMLDAKAIDAANIRHLLNEAYKAGAAGA